MQNFKAIKLRKGMKKEEINSMIGDYILFNDEEFKSYDYNHNWICKGKRENGCGNIIANRKWNNIRIRGSILCDYCRKDIEIYCNDINKIYLKPSTNKHEVNKIIDKWLFLKDDIYINSMYKHNWKCKCGQVIPNRTWSSIKRGYIHCKKCSYKKRISIEK